MNSEIETIPSRFATVHGSPGQGPRSLGPLRVFWPLAPICFAAGWLLRAALPFPNLSITQTGFLLLGLAVVLALFTVWSTRRLRSFLKGAEGEEKVARILAFLPAGYTIFNDLQLDDNETAFDHIVVGPSGVYVIETKNWSGEITFENGQVLYNGQVPGRPPIKQVKEAVAALLDHLQAAQCPDVPIYPVLCFVNNRPQGGLTNIGGVRICTDTDLPGLFENALENPVGSGACTMIADELTRCVEET